MTYETKPATKAEVSEMQKSLSSPLGHIITGYGGNLKAFIECSDERTAIRAGAVYLRRRMPSGKFIYRRMVAVWSLDIEAVQS